jgi:class 3 adenylate cyclase
MLGGVVAAVGRPYPGFLASVDARVFPVEAAARAAGLETGDRIVAVDGRSPLTLAARAREGGAAIAYEVERGERRFVVAVPPAPFTWATFLDHFVVFFVVSAVMLAAGVLVYAQSPAAAPNRNFLLYMCLWAVTNVASGASVLGPDKTAGVVVALVSPLLSVHGWVFFLTYPVNAAREAWLRRSGTLRALYAAAFAAGGATGLTYLALPALWPEALLGRVYPVTAGALFMLGAVSFPIKILALLDTRRRAASPLVDQQTTILLAGIGLGLGLWQGLMLAPLLHYYPPPLEPQLASALVLFYPAAIAYAVVRYRLFDVTVVIRRSVVYAALATLVAATYALTLAATGALLATADVARSPWFAGGLMFVVALGFYPLRARVQRAVDRTFFRERYDAIAAVQTLARSMTGLLDLPEITRRLTTTVEALMHARGARLLTGDAPAGLGGALAAAPGALTRYELAADPHYGPVAPAALAACEALGAEVVVPLRFQDALRGVLVLGPKRADLPYTGEDLALLETLADQTAVAVANAEAHHRVVEYAAQLERSLMIRTNLAKFVPRRVRQLIEESPEAPSLDKRETDVTVLFADITGYTRLSSRLGGEALDALVERYFGAFLDEIVKHGGDVNETAGDGLMVIFHEGNHARAAVDAARGIQRRAAELNAETAGRLEPLLMRVGVNTGGALLGATKIEGRAGTRWTYTASGLTTNLAARVAGVAEGGEIVLSESTRARLGADVPVEDLGTRVLRGVDRPIRLSRLLH